MEVNSMIILIILLSMILLLTILLFTVVSKIIFHLDSTTSELNLTLLWLSPFLRSELSPEGNKLILEVFVFNKRILKKAIEAKKKPTRNKSFIRNIHPTDINVNMQYGFRDPYFIGLVSSAVSMITQLFNVESLDQKPDFVAFDNYVSMDATAKLNLGRTLLKLI